jgi:hypothetical protein
MPTRYSRRAVSSAIHASNFAHNAAMSFGSTVMANFVLATP